MVLQRSRDGVLVRRRLLTERGCCHSFCDGRERQGEELAAVLGDGKTPEAAIYAQ